MAMKKTLLAIVQEILSDMDSEDVNSLSDTLEAQQVAQIVETTFYNIIATRDIPEHGELLKITALADNTYPTHFILPENVREIEKVWYQDDEGDYYEIKWCDPFSFLDRVDRVQDDYVSVLDKNGGTTLRIKNDKNPEYYTTFDDLYIVMDSYKVTVDDSLQQSKVRAFGTVFPEFSRTDSYVPDIDAVMFPYLINESKSVAFSILKGGTDPKIEQASRRQKSYIQNDMHRTTRNRNWSHYGRS